MVEVVVSVGFVVVVDNLPPSFLQATPNYLLANNSKRGKKNRHNNSILKKDSHLKQNMENIGAIADEANIGKNSELSAGFGESKLR
ncbi:unnamed protein product [Meloidogyne enterolobii]|uniref:Uncharacterized protein n=1 Tax=Meloidogyne enterolobii TaxID=390850 RepID=A0ACB0YKK5_MELEN